MPASDSQVDEILASSARISPPSPAASIPSSTRSGAPSVSGNDDKKQVFRLNNLHFFGLTSVWILLIECECVIASGPIVIGVHG